MSAPQSLQTALSLQFAHRARRGPKVVRHELMGAGLRCCTSWMKSKTGATEPHLLRGSERPCAFLMRHISKHTWIHSWSSTAGTTFSGSVGVKSLCWKPPFKIKHKGESQSNQSINAFILFSIVHVPYWHWVCVCVFVCLSLLAANIKDKIKRATMKKKKKHLWEGQIFLTHIL